MAIKVVKPKGEWSFRLDPAAQADIDKLGPEQQARVRRAVAELEVAPRCGAELPQGARARFVRGTDLAVVYRVDDARHQGEVLRVVPHEQVFKWLG
jgi:hypothetical protein